MITHTKNFNWKKMRAVYEWLPLFRGDVQVTGKLTVHDYEKFVYYFDDTLNGEAKAMLDGHSENARVEGELVARDECNK